MNEPRNGHYPTPLTTLLALPEAERQARGLAFTPREIFQQPDTWRETYRCLAAQRAHWLATLQTAGISKDAAPNIILTGAGTSDYIGQCLAQLLAAQWQCNVVAVPSTTLLTECSDYLRPGQPYLLISFSRSGDSAEGVAVLQKVLAERPDIQHIVITCNDKGQMAQLGGEPQVCCLVLDDATNDRGLAMTSSFTNMVVAGQIMAARQHLDHYADSILDRLCAAGEQVLSRAAGLAAELVARDFKRVCYIGAGALYGVAREAALKTLELTAGRILTMHETPLGLRHGPLSALNEETLLVTFLARAPRRRRYELALMEEIKAKNIGVTQLAITPDAGVDADFILTYDLPLLPDEYRPPVDIIFGQLFGLFASLHHGLHPDTPSPNGAITRVVSHLAIA